VKDERRTNQGNKKCGPHTLKACLGLEAMNFWLCICENMCLVCEKYASAYLILSLLLS
jgi:hypothetical protein